MSSAPWSMKLLLTTRESFLPSRPYLARMTRRERGGVRAVGWGLHLPLPAQDLGRSRDRGSPHPLPCEESHAQAWHPWDHLRDWLHMFTKPKPAV